MSATTTDFQLLPLYFNRAAELYCLRESDREAWDRRTPFANASWLIHILSARLRESEEHSAEIIRMARTRAEDLAGADCLVDSMPIRERFDYEQYGRVVAEKHRLRNGAGE